MSTLRRARTRLAVLCTFTALTHGSHGQAADPPPAKAPTISWTWSTVKAQPGAPRGYAQFERDCVVCHGSGPAKPGTRALRQKYHGKVPALLAERTDLAPNYIKQVVRGGAYVMPPFRKTELSDADLEAIVTYLTRNHR
jgi:mono/diheme cytochrome c family protein